MTKNENISKKKCTIKRQERENYVSTLAKKVVKVSNSEKDKDAPNFKSENEKIISQKSQYINAKNLQKLKYLNNDLPIEEEINEYLITPKTHIEYINSKSEIDPQKLKDQEEIYQSIREQKQFMRQQERKKFD
jgi:hypothetical protein